jgi:hypothetical protein
MPDEGRLVDEREMRGVGKQIRLPWSKAVEIAVKSLRIRFGRSLVTTASIILAIAFLMSILTGTTLVGSLRTRPARRVYWARQDARLTRLQTDLDTANATVSRLEAARDDAELAGPMRARLDRELEAARARRDELAEAVAAAKTRYDEAGRTLQLPELPDPLDLEAVRARRETVQKLGEQTQSSAMRPVIQARLERVNAEYEIAIRGQNARSAREWIAKLQEMRGDTERLKAELPKISDTVRTALEEVERGDRPEARLPALLEEERAAQLEHQRRILAEQQKTEDWVEAEKKLGALQSALGRLDPPGSAPGGLYATARTRIRQLESWLASIDARDPRRPALEATLQKLQAGVEALRAHARLIAHTATLGELAESYGTDATAEPARAVNRLAGALVDLTAAQFPWTAVGPERDKRLWDLESELLIPDLRKPLRKDITRRLQTERLKLRKTRMDASERLEAGVAVAKELADPDGAAAAREAVRQLEARLARRDLSDEDRRAAEQKLIDARSRIAELYRPAVIAALEDAQKKLAGALRTALETRIAEAQASLAYLERTEPSRIEAERRRWPALAARVHAEEAQAEWLRLWRDLQSGGYTDVPREISSEPVVPGFIELLTDHMDPRDQWLALLASLVCFVGILNAMLMSVHERFREIGTMKCLGALESFIIKLYFLESSFIGIAGTVLGIGIGFALTMLRSAFAYGVGTTLSNIDVSGALLSALGTLLIGALLSVGAAIFPAVSAAKMEPVDAMRVEE